MLHFAGFGDTEIALIGLLNLKNKLHHERIIIYRDDNINSDNLQTRNYTHIRKNLYQLTKQLVDITLLANPGDVVICTLTDILLRVCHEKGVEIICVNPDYRLHEQIIYLQPEIYDKPNILLEIVSLGISILKNIGRCEIITTANNYMGAKQKTYDMTQLTPYLVDANREQRYEADIASALLNHVTALNIPYDGASTMGVIFYPDKLWIGINFPNEIYYLNALSLYMQLTDDTDLLKSAIKKVFI